MTGPTLAAGAVQLKVHVAPFACPGNEPVPVWFIYCRDEEFATAVNDEVDVSVPAFEFVAVSSAVS